MLKILSFKDVPENKTFFVYNSKFKTFDKFIKYEDLDCSDEANTFNISMLESGFVDENEECVILE